MKENAVEPVDPAFPIPATPSPADMAVELELKAKEPGSAEPVSIARQTASGAMILAVASLGVQGLSALNTVVVARFLTMGDYGTVAMAMVVIAFAGVFVGSVGFAPTIISGRMKDPDAIITGHWLICLVGLLLGGLCFATSPIAAHFFKNPAVVPVLGAASLMLAINSWRVVPKATMQAANRFTIIAVISIVEQLAASVAGIILAIMGMGVWALIGPSVLIAVIGSIALGYYSGMKFRPVFRWRSISPFVREGLHLLGNGITNYIFETADQLAIGRFLGQIELGAYTFSYGLVERSLDLFSRTISVPLLSSLGQLGGDPLRVDRAVVRTCVALARLVFPVAAGGIILASLILKALAGPRWASTAPLVQVFFVLGALQSVAQISGAVWMALGRTRLVLWWGLTSNLSVLGAFLGGAIWGKSAIAVAVAYTGYSLFVLLPLCIWATRKWCGLQLNGLATGILHVFRDVAIMTAAVWLTNYVFVRAHVPSLISLILQIGIGALVYLTCFRLAGSAEMVGMLSAMPRKIQRLATRFLALPQAEAASA